MMWYCLQHLLTHRRPGCMMCMLIRNQTSYWLQTRAWLYYIIAAWLMFYAAMIYGR